MSTELETSPCPMGCTAGDDFVLRGGDRINGLPGEFTVVRCRTCGLMRTDPRPGAASMSMYYPDDYGPYRSSLDGSQPAWKRLGHALLESNANRIPEQPPGTLLEIGCASGAYLKKMAADGWQVSGIEYSSLAGERARRLGFSVHIGSIETAPPPAHKLDLVVGWMVLEHLYDPLLALRKLHEWSRTGASLVLSTPNAGAWEFRHFKEDWYALHLPNHLYHFTPDTVRALLARTGWRVERVLHQRTIANLVASLGNRMERRNQNSSVARWLKGFPDHGRFAKVFSLPMAYLMAARGQTGRMTIWARRIDTDNRA